jgi:hypothetical protein
VNGQSIVSWAGASAVYEIPIHPSLDIEVIITFPVPVDSGRVMTWTPSCLFRPTDDTAALSTMPPQVLESLDLAAVAKYIQSGRCENVVLMVSRQSKNLAVY